MPLIKNFKEDVIRLRELAKIKEDSQTQKGEVFRPDKPVEFQVLLNEENNGYTIINNKPENKD